MWDIKEQVAFNLLGGYPTATNLHKVQSMQLVVWPLMTKKRTVVFMLTLPLMPWVICDIKLASFELANEGCMR